MHPHNYKRQPNLLYSNEKGLTLVELIIVITILAIVGTIGLISLQGFSLKSRNTTRVSALSLLEHSMSIFSTVAGKYPLPDDQYAIGNIGLNPIIINGYVGNNMIQTLKINAPFKDPSTSSQIYYGVDSNQLQWQASLEMEGTFGYSRNIPGIQTAYALDSTTPIVQGNFDGQVKVDSIACSVPSLLISGSGTIDLTSDTTYFVYNEGKNYPGPTPRGLVKSDEVFKKLGNPAPKPICSVLGGWLGLSGQVTQSGALTVLPNGDIAGTLRVDQPVYPSSQFLVVTGTGSLDGNNILTITGKAYGSGTITSNSGDIVGNGVIGGIGAISTIITPPGGNATITLPGTSTGTGAAIRPTATKPNGKNSNGTQSSGNPACMLTGNICACTTLVGQPKCSCNSTQITSVCGPDGIIGDGGASTPPSPNITYSCSGLIGSANPDQWGTNNGYSNFNLCTNTQVLTTLNNIPSSNNLNTPGGRDIYAFILEQGKTYNIETLGDNSNTDTAIFLYDNVGNKVSMNDDGAGIGARSKILYTAITPTGYYYIGAMAYEDAGGIGTYTLSITETATPCWIPQTAGSTYPGCNEPDIIVCGKTIASCNVGAVVAGTNWVVSGGKYFQWGRNKGFTYSDNSQQSTTIDGSIGLNETTDTNGFVWNTGFPPPYTWATTDITNNWGDTTNTLVSRQGPCPSGYHIPSQIEWEALVTDGQWGMDGITLSNTLKLPFAGSRLYYNGSIVQAGDQGNYWSSTPLTTTQASNFYVTPGGSGYTGVSVPNYNTYKSAGFSVRCFKN